MTYDPIAQPINQPRRKDRTIEDEAWIEAFLLKAPFGILATSLDGQPFINSNLFVYDPEAYAIYIHTSTEGRTRYNVEMNPRACFSVSEMGRLLPASTARNFSVEYSGVTVFGQIHVLDNEAEAQHGLQLLLDKYFPHLHPGQEYRSIQADELADTAVYRLDIESWSGKQKAAPADFPGAFLYEAHNRA